MDATLDAARAAAAGPTAAYLASKMLVTRLRDERMSLWETLAAEAVAQTQLSRTEDYREGFAAFQQKRAARFRGH
jgi:enoyl-CoA hydratase/carnithine racemase